MLGTMLENVRNTCPLVHNITNYVTVNDCANILLACGGYPGNPYMMQQLDPLGTSVTTACSFSPGS